MNKGRRFPDWPAPEVPPLSLFGSSHASRAGPPNPRGPVFERADRVVHFFAVLPPDAIRSDIARLRLQTVERERIVGRPVSPERLHVSLARLCDCAPTEVSRSLKSITALADEIASHVTMPRFDVCFDRLQTFINVDRRTRVRRCLLVLSDESGLGLHRLHDLVWASFAVQAIRIPKAFNPHMTLHYGNRPIAARDIPPYSWTVEEFALVQSFHGQSKHVVLKRWPLSG